MIDVMKYLNTHSRPGKVIRIDNVTVARKPAKIKSRKPKETVNEHERDKKKSHSPINFHSRSKPGWENIDSYLTYLNDSPLVPDNPKRLLTDSNILKRMPDRIITVIRGIKLFFIHQLIPTTRVTAFQQYCVDHQIMDVQMSLQRRDNHTEVITIYTKKGRIEIINSLEKE